MRMDREPTLDAFRFDLAIAKRKLEVRRAWEIGPNDPDLPTLMDDDNPIIPVGVEDPPVRKALEAVRAMRARQREGMPGGGFFS